MDPLLYSPVLALALLLLLASGLWVAVSLLVSRMVVSGGLRLVKRSSSSLGSISPRAL